MFYFLGCVLSEEYFVLILFLRFQKLFYWLQTQVEGENDSIIDNTMFDLKNQFRLFCP